MNQPPSHGLRDFFIALVVMLAFIFLTYAIAGNDPDNGPTHGESCPSGIASGAGC